MDGAGFNIEGPGMGGAEIHIDADNVTVKNMWIVSWDSGILVYLKIIF